MCIKLNNLTVVYDRHPAIHHVSATIDAGQLLAVVGPNGAGKSTLLNAMADLSPLQEGTIDGLCPKHIAYLPQQTKVDSDFPMTVIELVSTGMWQQLGFTRGLKSSQYERCRQAIAAVGLSGFEDRIIGSLSGGQLQRCLFARVLLQDCPVILLDEPFNAIDSKTINELTQIIQQWSAEKRTVIMVTHDLDYVKQHCPYTLILARECIAYGPSVEVLNEVNLTRASQQSEAFDDNATWCQRGVV